MAIYKYVKITLTVLKFLIFYRKEFFWYVNVSKMDSKGMIIKRLKSSVLNF